MQNQNSQQPPPAPPPPPNEYYTPGRAALCAIIPGIGAVYNREYMKGVVHFSIFAGLILIAESVGVFGVAAFSFYVYSIIDAYRSAEIIARRGGPKAMEGQEQDLNLPLWGSILLLMGVLFLLDNLGAIRLRSAIQFWPLILIFLGGYLIYSYVQKEKNGFPFQRSSESRAPYTPPERPQPAPSPETRPEVPGGEDPEKQEG